MYRTDVRERWKARWEPKAHTGSLSYFCYACARVSCSLTFNSRTLNGTLCVVVFQGLRASVFNGVCEKFKSASYGFFSVSFPNQRRQKRNFVSPCWKGKEKDSVKWPTGSKRRWVLVKWKGAKCRKLVGFFPLITIFFQAWYFWFLEWNVAAVCAPGALEVSSVWCLNSCIVLATFHRARFARLPFSLIICIDLATYVSFAFRLREAYRRAFNIKWRIILARIETDRRDLAQAFYMAIVHILEIHAREAAQQQWSKERAKLRLEKRVIALTQTHNQRHHKHM